MSFSLFNNHTLTFTWYPVAKSPQVGRNGKPIAETATPTSENINGDLQTVTGRDVVILPHGATFKEARFFYTQTRLQTANHKLGLDSAKTEIDGYTFVIINEEDNTGYGLDTDHYAYTLVKELV